MKVHAMCAATCGCIAKAICQCSVVRSSLMWAFFVMISAHGNVRLVASGDRPGQGASVPVVGNGTRGAIPKATNRGPRR